MLVLLLTCLLPDQYVVVLFFTKVKFGQSNVGQLCPAAIPKLKRTLQHFAVSYHADAPHAQHCVGPVQMV